LGVSGGFGLVLRVLDAAIYVQMGGVCSGKRVLFRSTGLIVRNGRILGGLRYSGRRIGLESAR